MNNNTRPRIEFSVDSIFPDPILVFAGIFENKPADGECLSFSNKWRQTNFRGAPDSKIQSFLSVIFSD